MPKHKTHAHSAPEVRAEDLRNVVNSRSKELRLTREKVAKAAGVGRSTLFDWLAGTGQPSATGWKGLATALSMSVPDLFAAAGVDLGSPVERARLERGWTRGDLASEAGVSFATVRQVEEGQRLRPDAAARIARALDLEADFVSQTARVSAPAETPLGRAVERERLARGWTIADLARHLGTARQLVSAWLLGAEPVAARWLPKLADFTGLGLEEIRVLAAESAVQRPSASLGQSIRAARAAAGWSQHELADRVGVSTAAVEQWEAGRRAPSLGARARLDDVLGRSTRSTPDVSGGADS